MINVSDYYQSTAIQTIDFNDEDQQVTLTYTTNPNKEYTYNANEYYPSIKEVIYKRLNTQKEYPTSTNSIGSYIYSLRQQEYLIDA